MYKENLKTRVNEARCQAKMSKTDLAVKLNVSYPTYLKLEKSGNYDIDQLEILCNVFEWKVIIMPNSISELR